MLLSSCALPSTKVNRHRSASRGSVMVKARNRERGQQQQQQQQQVEDASAWMPPAAWVSAVLGQLHHSVDVDSVEPYTQLFQECVVLQPALLRMSPQQAAATCWCLERHTRSSAVWYGPSMISTMLTQHNPHSITQHISSLMDHWISLGQTPHSFGQLWLQAPSALLHFKSVTSFESHLAQLAQMVPELTPSELLNSSTSLAGYLLSLDDVVVQLKGHVHREVPGVVVISHHSLRSVQIVQQPQPQPQQQQQQRQQQQQQQQQNGPIMVAVYAALQAAEAPAENSVSAAVVVIGSSGSSSSSSNSSSPHVAPWQQQPERKHTGGLYEQQPQLQQQQQTQPHQQQQQQQQLLAEFEVWPGRQGARILPVYTGPPRSQQ